MKLDIINIWVMGFWLYSAILYQYHIVCRDYPFWEICKRARTTLLHKPLNLLPSQTPNLGTYTWTSNATSLTRWHCLYPNSRGLALTQLTLKIILWNYKRTAMIYSQKKPPTKCVTENVWCWKPILISHHCLKDNYTTQKSWNCHVA